MTKQEASVISAFTGVMCCDFSDMHKYAEEVMEQPIFTHQFGDEAFAKELKEKAKPDFIDICKN